VPDRSKDLAQLLGANEALVVGLQEQRVPVSCDLQVSVFFVDSVDELVEQRAKILPFKIVRH
jgi:hypothetical protein